MEIIHIILGKANPNRMNGVNKVVYELATHQMITGRNVSVWGITSDLSHNYGSRNFETKLFHAYKNPFKIDSKLKDALLKKKGKAIIHFHGGWIPIYYSLSKFLVNQQIEFVITPHGAYNTIAMERTANIKSIYFRLLEKQLLKRAAKIHAIGASEIEGLNNIYLNDKSILIPYGFEMNETNEKAKVKSTEFIIGFVGRLDIYTKGLDILIEAFHNFLKLNPNTKLWLIGGGKGQKELNKIIKEHKIEEHVILFGSQFGKEKENLIMQMDVFVHPSRNEGLPVSVIEACGLGIPAIVSNATNIASYITKHNAGISIKNNNTVSLLLALKYMHLEWEQNNLQIKRSNAKIMVEESFNWHKLIKEFDNLYRQ